MIILVKNWVYIGPMFILNIITVKHTGVAVAHEVKRSSLTLPLGAAVYTPTILDKILTPRCSLMLVRHKA